MGFTEWVLVREQQVLLKGQNQIKLAFEKAHSVYGGEKSLWVGEEFTGRRLEMGDHWEAENMVA